MIADCFSIGGRRPGTSEWCRAAPTALWFIEENNHFKIFLRIIDNGAGFNFDSTSGSTGLVGMRERAEVN